MAKFIYYTSIRCYTLGIRIASLWNNKARLWVAGRKTFPKIDQSQPAKNNIWMHCASLGEFEQGRPVLEQLKKQFPDSRIFLSFFSPSGYEVTKNYPVVDVIFYLPIDSPSNAKKLIDEINPNLVLWVKYEFWYYYLNALHQRKIPLLLISGIFRKKQPFFKWYGGIWREMLASFTHFFVQNEESKRLLEKIPVKPTVTVSGDTRFDRVLAIAQNFEPIKEIEAFVANRPVIVAGSTWTEDDEELDHFANTHPEISFLIAPHEIAQERLQECLKLYKNSMLYSQWVALKSSPEYHCDDPILPHLNCIIIDNIGMLSRLYYYATICYVGGGFGEDGVHNVIEAAVYGKPVLLGPVYEKYIEAKELLEKQGGISINSALELEEVLNDLLTDDEWYKTMCLSAKNYVAQNKGATHSILYYIQEKRLLTS